MGNYLKRFKYLLFLVMTALLFSQSALAEGEGKVTPAYNTDIGNQATLTYTGLDNEMKIVLSNIVITRVQQLYSVSITPDRTATTYPGQTVLFSHTVKNNGNGPDEILVTPPPYPAGYTVKMYLDTNSNGQIDNGETAVTTTLGTIPGNSSVSLLVSVTTPTNGSGTVGPYIISVSSKGDPSKIGSANESITYTQFAAVSVMKALGSSEGMSDIDREVDVYFKIGNSTAATDAVTFNLTETLDSNFKYVPDSARWVNFGSETEVKLPDNGSGGGVTFASNAASGAISLQVPTIPKDSPIGKTGGYLKFKVKVLARTPVMTIYNKGSYTYTNAPTGGTAVPSADTNTVSYDVLKYVQATFTGWTIEEAEQGELLKFENKLTNTANAPETYDLSTYEDLFPAGTQFTMTIIAGNGNETFPRDTTGDGNEDTGILGVNETIKINLYAKLPVTAYGKNYSIIKKATSSYNKEYSVTATDLVKTVSTVSVDLTNNQSLIQNETAPGYGKGPEQSPVTQISINPGSEGIFELYVNNTNKYVTDDFALDYSTSPSFANNTLPDGVTVKFANTAGAEITRTGELQPGGNLKVVVTVSTTKDVLAGTQALYFRAKSVATGASDIKYDAYTITATRSIAITPNNTGYTYAGGTIVYPHTVKNNGNVLEGDGISSSLNLFTTNSLTNWTSQIFLDVDGNGVYNPVTDVPFVDFATIGGLKPGQSVGIFIKVISPVTAQTNEKDYTVINGNLSQGTYPSSPIVTSATDTTTIQSSTLTIEKFQSLDGNIYTKALQLAKPGQKIYYKIVTKNTGNVDAKDVVIQDNVPQYTSINKKATYTLTPSGGSEGAPKTAETSPDANGKGAIVAKPGVVQGNGGMATLYFDVTIDKGSEYN
ncbi:MAG: hypothetical protein RR191_05280 [Cetobacterium sp.]|uniref:COG1470 family protein n=1 Tax=Cetobacterium sp. TaxID=2071632 RepID=UPI002FCC768B